MEICNLELAHFIEFVPGNSDDDYEINIVEIKRDPDWFNNSLPKMKKFWDDVLEYRKKGIENHPKFKIKTVRKYKERPITVINKCLFLHDPLDDLIDDSLNEPEEYPEDYVDDSQVKDYLFI